MEFSDGDDFSALRSLAIVAESGATASDVLRLIHQIRERVQRVFGTELELEIEIWKPVRGKVA